MANQKAPGQHEDINIQESVHQNRIKLVRQTRKDVTHLDCYLELNKKKLKVENLSPFGLLLQSEEEIKELSLEGVLVINNLELGQVRLRVIRSTGGLEQNNKVACEVLGEPISVECVQSVEDTQTLIQSLEKRQSTAKKIPDLFARKIYEIKDWLEEIQEKINKQEKLMNKNDTVAYQEYENTFVQVMGEYFNSIMPIKNTDLGHLLGEQSPEMIKTCYEFMREQLKKIIYQAPFSDRVYNKPLGYAGDYEMMNIIYQNNALGESLFAKCLHNYWVKQPAAQAVRNRAQYIQKKIEALVESRKGDNLGFLSVASGPAMEWQNILRDSKHRNAHLQVTLLDQDETALIHAQRKMRELTHANPSPIVFKYENKAIKNILARGLPEQYDMIYSAGLFDYFSDPVAQLAAQKLYDGLRPKGKLIIGNFDVSNPNSIIMDSALDWRLLYRSADDLKLLFKHLGANITVEQESLNINIFCVIEKP